MWPLPPSKRLKGSFEMPHVENNGNSQYERDSSVEPCLKRYKPEYSTSWSWQHETIHKQTKTETQEHNWNVFSSSYDFKYESFETKRSDTQGAKFNKGFRNDSVVFNSTERVGSTTGLFHDHSSNSPNNARTVCDMNHQPHEKVFEKDYSNHNMIKVCSNSNFSETSNVFIGPLPPPAKMKEKEIKCHNNRSTILSDKNVSDTSRDFIGPHLPTNLKVKNTTENVQNDDRGSNLNKPHCYKIRTVEVGKIGRPSGRNAMDYELRQFYKELQELSNETDDQVDNMGVTHKLEVIHQPSFSARKSNPEPISQVGITGPYNEKPIPDEHNGCNLNNLSNRYSCVNSSVPPSRFQCPPPPPPQTFTDSYVPPAPRYSYPPPFPRQETLPYRSLPPNEQISGRFDECHRHNGHHQWNSSHVSENNQYNDQLPRHKMSPPAPYDLCRNRHQEQMDGRGDGHKGPVFNASFTAPNVGILHKQYLHKARENSLQRKLVLLRGVPGSGKTTLARVLLNVSPNGIVYSTDDYFCQREGYTYDVKLLGDAHLWNQDRARKAMDEGRSPVIIDNTNTQSWEMKPYVQMAVERGYLVEFLEPDTWWKLNPLELEKRNKHGVPRDKISQMLDRYEYDMTVPSVMNSVDPPHKSAKRPPAQARQRWEASVNASSVFHNR
ncbi:NEDD4-binding protein 2-like 2 [Bombina bombina]|uniref:NEDD4-binding protein 2-like 2 n=1 Tax=Bombina bombina TaxID=8345 RepID=UPI00235B1FC8|nr:NEDD4-binding protein 2-like 2 [Bombina bombina]